MSTNPVPDQGKRVLATIAQRMSNGWLWRVRFAAEDELRRRADEAGRRWDAANVASDEIHHKEADHG